MKILPIGSIIQLSKEKEQLLMVTSRFPLYNKQGEIGYFDYAGCLYPQGQTSQENFFFNTEDIEKVLFEGFINETENALQLRIHEEIKNITYPKFDFPD
ncbi:DUF4176 domain-containing protein [Enterococcus sp. BWR-S5]|uniref:DUF4176 domain-containing protein n=1 Tax=Enterococcus sp. BWR-S5 TaxID=2787714 RepID=UPI001920C551|nr:DUF4176 domain-containing protein [Enterococcus sp. BWR-S5]MBL1226039.1 DUF4176 domain-containing protein [Enterococcus sp. BWR-S5]